MCGTQAVDDSSTFCNNCGTQLIQNILEEKNEICPNCGTKILDKESVFCLWCGSPVSVNNSEVTNKNLVSYAREWLLKPVSTASAKRGACSVVITEMTSSATETPDAIGWHSRGCVVVECKASRSDFRKDRSKFFRVKPEYGTGDNRYILTPEGLVEEEELLDGWGLLEVKTNGKVKIVRASAIFTTNFVNERKILLSLIRRLDLKTEGKHIAIKMYEIKGDKTPRATGTIIGQDTCTCAFLGRHIRPEIVIEEE
jgi:DNA-directed RNA polymerase subunit RPC12/RpoP